ncbi:MAG: aminotransferase class IV [bacterium]
MGTMYHIYCNAATNAISLVDMVEFTTSFDDVSVGLPAGAYVTFRTYGGNNAFHLQDHIDRLLYTMRVAIVLHQQITNFILETLHKFLRQPLGQDRRIRMIIPFTDWNELYILEENLMIPEPQDYENGVIVVTGQYERSEPDRKQTSFISESLELRKRINSFVNEVLLVDRNGRLLEGLSSNIFFVKDGTIFTAGAGVLEGVTRKIVLEVCNQFTIPIEFTAVQLKEISSCDEAFLSSTSRGVLPVVRIDQQVIGKGIPGEITRRVMVGFAARIDEGLEAF